jgi:hypothetical protein
MLIRASPFYSALYLPVRSVCIYEEFCINITSHRVLRRIFQPEREEVAGDWRRLHNEELHSRTLR